MDKSELENLDIGDIILHKLGNHGVQIIHPWDGTEAIGITVYTISNPSEWDLILKCHHEGKGR